MLTDFGSHTGKHELSPFVGRSAELQVVSDALNDLRDGRGQILVVVGEGGIGKSRLVKEAKIHASSEVLWLEARCDSLDQALPYEPFIQSLRMWLGLHAQSSAIETRVRLSSRGRPLLGGRFEEVAPHLARLLGIRLEPRLDRRLDGFPRDVLTSSLLSAYSEWLSTLGRTTPVVLAIDNLDAASEATAAFASTVLSASEDSSVLVLATMRRVPTSAGWDVRVRALAEFSDRAREIVLRPLADAEADELVANLDVASDLRGRLRELVVRRAEGNPLYIEELVSTMSHGSRQQDEMPSALESLLLSRIDALPPEAKVVLQGAAVLGRDFRKDVLSSMGIVGDVDAALAALLRSELIRERGRMPLRFGFRHGLLRDASLSTLTPHRLRELHSAAAKALEAQTSWEDRDVEALARHCLASGDTERAIEWLEELADRLAAVFRLGEAVDLLDRCLNEFVAQAGERCARLARKQGELLVRLADFTTALSALDLAERHAQDEGERAELQLARALALIEGGRLDDAMAVVDGALGNGADEAMSARLRILKGRIAFEGGNIGMAASESAAVAVDSLEPTVAFDAASLRAGIAAVQGDLDKAEVWALRSQQFAERSGQLSRLLTAKRHVALICYLKGHVGEAYELMKTVYERYVDVGFILGQLEAGGNLVYLSSLVGDLGGSQQIAERLLGLSRGQNWDVPVRANLANVMFERGDLDAAETIARALLVDDSSSLSWTRVSAYLVVAGVLMARRQVDEAESVLAEAGAVAQDAQRDAELASVYATQAEVALMKGNVTAASVFTASARQSLGGAERAVQLRLDRVCSLVDALEGDPRGRLSLEADAIEARRMGLRIEEARALLSLGSLDPENSEHHFAEAERIFRECECRRGLAELEEARRGALISATN